MRTYTLLPFLLAAAVFWLAACSPAPAASNPQATAAAQATDLDLATTQVSAQGLYTVTYKSELDPITINQLHTWTLRVEDAAGAPLDGATVTVDGGMPAHNHGMPTQPIVTSQGSGDYRVEGMKFQMPGHWIITVAVDAAGQQDTATFNLMLN
jgi:nitrogen fixation protein FixH